jgi:hypothetical protein
MQAVVLGAAGGLVTLIGKYVIDRLTESHKAALGLASKRKERFYEKQAAVISGTYRRMDRCISDLSELYFHGDEGHLEPLMANAVENQLGEKLNKATKSFKSLESFYDEYNLFLPESLDQAVLSYILLAERHLNKFEVAFVKGFDELNEVVVHGVVELRSQGVTVLAGLKKQFRELLTGDPSVKS